MSTATVFCENWPSPTWHPWSGASFDEPLALFVAQVSASQTSLPHLRTWLAPDEQERASRFRQPGDQQRFVLGRALVRFVLGRYLHRLPSAVQLALTNSKKPYLADTTILHLNLSHAGDWVVLAVADVPVGVDTEIINSEFDFESLLPVSFSEAEQHYICSSADPRQTFYRLWTRKEALVKATGLGMTDDFTSVPCLDGQHHRSSHLIGQKGQWIVQSFTFATSQIVTVAHAGASKTAKVYTVSPDFFVSN